MANKEDIKVSDLSMRDKWALFLGYMSSLERNSRGQATSHKVNEGGKEFPVTDGGCKTLAHDLAIGPHQKGSVPADPHGCDDLQAENPTTGTDQTGRVSSAIGGTEPPAANAASRGREASAEIVAKGNHWTGDEARHINKIEPESEYATAIYDDESSGLSQSSLLSVMGGISEHIPPRQNRRRYTGAEKQSAVDISNEKIFQGKGPNGTRGKKVTSRLLGIPISTLYKWESDGMKSPPNNTTGFVVNYPSSAGVQDSPKLSNVGTQDSPKPSSVGVQDSPEPSNAQVQDSPKPSNVGVILQHSPKPSNVGVILQHSPKPSSAGVRQDSPKQSNTKAQNSPKYEGSNMKMHQGIRYTDEDKLLAIEMSRQKTKNGTGRNGTRGKASVARQIGVSVKTMWRWEQNEHFYRMRLKQQRNDQDITGRKLLMLHKACEMVQDQKA